MTKSNKRKIIVILLIILMLPVFLLSRLKRPGSGDIEKEIKPFYGTIQVMISATAIVQPQNRLEIKPPINGRLDEILVKEGEKVKSGQIIAWMSSTERAALLDAARAQGEESVNYWKDVYKPTPLLSPIDGQVIVCTNEPGKTVTSADVIIVLSDRLIVQAQVDETDIGKVSLGQDVDISLDAYPEIKVKGKVDHIYYESKIVNNVTIYKVDIIPETVPAVFRSGMSATVDIIENEKKDILLLPLEAVKKDKEGSYVLISRGIGEKPVERNVVLGISDEKNVEIISGITDKDTVLFMSQKYSPERESTAKSNPLIPARRRPAQR